MHLVEALQVCGVPVPAMNLVTRFISAVLSARFQVTRKFTPQSDCSLVLWFIRTFLPTFEGHGDGLPFWFCETTPPQRVMHMGTQWVLVEN
jgi:hypothetical protein